MIKIPKWNISEGYFNKSIVGYTGYNKFYPAYNLFFKKDFLIDGDFIFYKPMNLYKRNADRGETNTESFNTILSYVSSYGDLETATKTYFKPNKNGDYKYELVELNYGYGYLANGSNDDILLLLTTNKIYSKEDIKDKRYNPEDFTLFISHSLSSDEKYKKLYKNLMKNYIKNFFKEGANIVYKSSVEIENTIFSCPDVASNFSSLTEMDEFLKNSYSSIVKFDSDAFIKEQRDKLLEPVYEKEYVILNIDLDAQREERI